MIINFFKSERHIFWIILPIAVVLLWLKVFYNAEYIVILNEAPLYRLVTFLLINRAIAVSFAVLLIIIEIFFINYIASKFNLLKNKTFLPALFYLTIISAMPSFMIFNPVIISNLLIMFSLYKLFITYGRDEDFKNVFDASIIMSIASLFFPPLIIVLIILFLVALFSLRPFLWRELVIAIIGLFITYLFAFAFYYIFLDENFFQIFNTLDFNFEISIPHNISTSYTIMFYVVAAILLLSLVTLNQSLFASKIKTRKYFQIINWLLFLSVIGIKFIPDNAIYYLSILAIPLSIVFANYFYNIKKKWIAECLYLILLGIIVYVNIIHF